jgi:hypothetical protein
VIEVPSSKITIVDHVPNSKRPIAKVRSSKK